MLQKLSVAGCLLVLTLCVPAAWAADDLLSSRMVDEARQWEQKGRADLAAALWRKLLQGSPKHPEALVKLGMIELAEGNTAQADSLLKRASRLPGSPAGVSALSAAIAKSRGLSSAIDTPAVKESVARAVIPQDRSELDIVIREKPTISNMTDEELLQSYQTARAGKQRWNSTRRGLEKLALAHPGDTRYSNALERHLELRETRKQKEAAQKRDLADGSIASKGTKETQSPVSKSDRVASILDMVRKTQQMDGESAREQERALLDEAMLLDPGYVPTRLALAQYYQRIDEVDSAATLLDDLIESNANLPAALQARAQLYAAQQRWWEGLETLEKIPVSVRSAENAKEQQRLWVNAQVQRAKYLFRQGNSSRANAILEQAQVGARADSPLIALVAQAWSDVGQSGKALRIMRDMIGSSQVRNKGTQIKYARILLDNRQDAELSGVLRDLSLQAGLTPTQQDDINRIILGFTLRMTETLREAGKLSEAAAMINPALQRIDDVRLLLTMARIYQSAGNPDAALELVERVIAQEPEELSHRLLAGDLALAGNALAKAQVHASAALGLAAEHPRVLALAGRVEKAMGDTPRAIAYFQRAQTQEATKGPSLNGAGMLSLRLIDNEPVLSQLPRAVFDPSTSERSGLLPLPDFLSQPKSAPVDLLINPNLPVRNAPSPARL